MPEVKPEKKRPEDQRIAGRGAFLSPFWSDPSDFFSMSPFMLMRRFTEEMDRAFAGSGAGFGAGSMWSPAVEVSERDGKMIVHADLPGLDKNDVKLEVTDSGLMIQGERKREHEEQGRGFHRSERSYGSFCRYIPLPKGAKTEDAQAKFDNGVLEVSIPVPAEQQRRREIPIGTGAAEKKQVWAESSAHKRESKAG